MRLLGLLLLILMVIVALPARTVSAQLAWIENDGVVVQDGEATADWPGSQGVETYCWDRDGRSLLVTRAGRLLRLGPDGRRTTLVHGYAEVRFPDVCAADGRIAFACLLTGGEPNDWQLRVVESDGRGNLELGAGYDPAFLPDGSGVVFECFAAPGPDVWIHDFDTGTRRRLFAEARPRYTPAISHDGRQLAFTSSGRLMLADLVGGAARDLSPQGATYDRFACFAPDDGAIAFFRERGETTSLVVRALDLDGEERVVPTGARATLPQFRPPLPQPILRSLTPEAAIALVAAAGRGPLALPDLESLSVETARVLATTKGSLVLDGLLELDLAAAQALAGWSGNGERFYLSLDGLRDPAPGILAALASSRGWGLSFGQLSQLTAPDLAALAPYAGASLRLHGLLELDEAGARVVAATWNVKWIAVDHETRVSQAARDALLAGRVELLGGSP